MSVETTVAGAWGAQGNSVQESGPIIKSFVEEKNTLIKIRIVFISRFFFVQKWNESTTASTFLTAKVSSSTIYQIHSVFVSVSTFEIHLLKVHLSQSEHNLRLTNQSVVG